MNSCEIIDAAKNGELEKILNYIKISKGDNFFIPSGKVHAICKDTTLLEISQSSDITYRLYDYHRLEKGKFRELHLEKAIEVLSIFENNTNLFNNNDLFTFEILKKPIKKNAHKFGDYLYIIEGTGTINGEKFNIGDFFMVTSSSDYFIMGNFKISLVRFSK